MHGQGADFTEMILLDRERIARCSAIPHMLFAWKLRTTRSPIDVGREDMLSSGQKNRNMSRVSERYR
jgi:hypothetical protein